MGYQEQISQCNNLDELFSVWRKKPSIQISYKDGEKEIRKTINHQEDFFIPDGIVNMDVWNSGSKKILFVLKEAYGSILDRTGEGGGGIMFGWLFGDTTERETDRKANDIAASPFWDGGSSDDILKKYSKDQINKIHDQVEEDEDFIDCMLF